MVFQYFQNSRYLIALIPCRSSQSIGVFVFVFLLVFVPVFQNKFVCRRGEEEELG